MYSLVLYKKSKEKDVVETTCVRTKNDGNKEAKSGNKYYAVKVLKEHNDPAFLESLIVTTDGEVLVPKKAPTPSNTLQKRQADQAVKEKSKASEKVNDELQKNLLSAPDIFTTKEQPNCHENDAASTANSESASTGDGTYKSESQSAKRRTEKNNHGDISKSQIPNILNCPLCHPQSRVPDDLAEYFISIGEFLKSRRNNGSSDRPINSMCQKRGSDLKMGSSLHNTNVERNSLDVCTLVCPSGSDMVELIPNSGVFIKSTEKFLIDRMDRKEPKDIVRELLRKIVGEENLCGMTLSGRSKNNNFVAVPEKELVTIQAYVESIVRPKYRLKLQEVRDCVTAFCNSLRQDKKRRGDDKIKNDGSLRIKIEGRRGAEGDVKKQALSRQTKEVNERESSDEGSSSEESEKDLSIERRSKKKKTLQTRGKRTRIEESWKNHDSSASDIESVSSREDDIPRRDDFSDCDTTDVQKKLLTENDENRILIQDKKSSQKSVIINEVKSQNEQSMSSPLFEKNTSQNLNRISPEKNSTSQSLAMTCSSYEGTDKSGPKKHDPINGENCHITEHSSSRSEEHKRTFSGKFVPNQSSAKPSGRPDAENDEFEFDDSKCSALDNQRKRDQSLETENDKLSLKSKKHHRSHSREKSESKDKRKDEHSYREPYNKKHHSKDRDSDNSTKSKKRHRSRTRSRSRDRSNSKKRRRHHHKSSRHSSKNKKSKRSHHRSRSRD